MRHFLLLQNWILVIRRSEAIWLWLYTRWFVFFPWGFYASYQILGLLWRGWAKQNLEKSKCSSTACHLKSECFIGHAVIDQSHEMLVDLGGTVLKLCNFYLFGQTGKCKYMVSRQEPQIATYSAECLLPCYQLVKNRDKSNLFVLNTSLTDTTQLL